MGKDVKYSTKGARKGACRGCHATIYWVRTPAGKWMPCDEDGTPHWATCPDAKIFKGDKE